MSARRKRRCLPGVRCVGMSPRFDQARSVDGCTPSSAAASLRLSQSSGASTLISSSGNLYTDIAEYRFCQFPQQINVLVNRLLLAGRNELTNLIALRQMAADVRLWVVGAAQVRAAGFFEADNQLAGFKGSQFRRAHFVAKALAMCGDQQISTGRENACQLVNPRHLRLGREVGKNRNHVNKIEALVGIRQRSEEHT